MRAERYARPVVVISRCIDFDSCRYNGQVIQASLREQLEPFVEFRPICPELEIGLGVPRDPVRLVSRAGTVHMVQPATGRDLTRAMSSFSERFLGSLAGVDGFVLKSRSPSCAIRDGKVFHSDDEDAGYDAGPGLFAARVLERFPAAAVEDEGRLEDGWPREHFLTKLFTLAAFRGLAADSRPRALVEFHARNEVLLMAYDETRLLRLARIVAEAPARLPADVAASYRDELATALARPPRERAVVNALENALGRVAERLIPAERRNFLGTLEECRAGEVPLSVPLGVLGLAPYPPALVRR